MIGLIGAGPAQRSWSTLSGTLPSTAGPIERRRLYVTLRARVTLPSLPSARKAPAALHEPSERYCVPTWQMRLYLRAACTMRRPSLRLWLTGFSR